MRAVILAGGKGQRLMPYTTVIPKPLLPVGDTPILEIVIRQLAHAGFDHITLTLGHLSEYIRAFLDHRKSLRDLAKIDVVVEEKPTGTAGSLSAVPGLDEPFLVMNGDLLTTLDYRGLFEHHRDAGAMLTIALHQKPVEIDLGVVKTDDRNKVVDYIEKPTLHYTVSMGVYVYRPEVVNYIPRDSFLDFPNLVIKLVEGGEKVIGFPNQAFWLDLGRREDLQRATEVFLERSSDFLPQRRGDAE